MIDFFPESASTVAPGIDLLFALMVAFSFALGIFLTVLIVRYAWIYRRGSSASREGRRARNLWLEASWSGASLLIAFGMFAWSASLFMDRNDLPEDAEIVLAHPKQWMWRFEHANGKREVNELHVPVGRPVVVDLVSEDVIHSFYVPAFRVKQDAVPGRITRVWFEATRPGRFDLFCAEYCGAQHSRMRGEIVALPPEDFAEWLSAGEPELTLAEEGERLFRAHGCSGCHGASAQVRAPDLHGLYGRAVPLADGTTVIADLRYLRDSILQPRRRIAAGYEPIMPSFDGLIEEGELMRIIAYLRAIGEEDAE